MHPARPVPAGPAPDDGRAAEIAVLYRRHRQALIRLLMRNGASADRAEDICQEAFLRLLASPASGAIMEKRSYLFRIAVNLAIDIGRRDSRHLARLESDAPLDELADPAPSPETLVMSRQNVDHLHRVIAQVPDVALAALAGRMRGLTFADIAEREGVSLKVAFDRTARAVNALRVLMNDNPPRLGGSPAADKGHVPPPGRLASCPWGLTAGAMPGL